MRQERGSRGSAREKCLGGVDSKASSLTMRNGALSTTASSINVKRWHGAGITKHGFGDKVGSWLRSRRLQSSVPSTYMTLCISILALTLAVLMLNSIRRPRNLSKCNPDRLESTNGMGDSVSKLYFISHSLSDLLCVYEGRRIVYGDICDKEVSV